MAHDIISTHFKNELIPYLQSATSQISTLKSLQAGFSQIINNPLISSIPPCNQILNQTLKSQFQNDLSDPFGPILLSLQISNLQSQPTSQRSTATFQTPTSRRTRLPQPHQQPRQEAVCRVNIPFHQRGAHRDGRLL
jgi:hypothetical protein